MIKNVFVCACIILAIPSTAQNVNGHWFGMGMLQTSKEYNPYLSEMVLQQKGKAVTGYLNYYFRDSLVKVSLTGNYDDQGHRLFFKPFPMMYYLSPNAKNSIDCYLSGSFVLLASKKESVLSGSLFGDEDHKYTVPAISYRLTRSNDTAVLVMKDEETEQKKDTIITVAPIAPAENPTIAIFKKREKTVTKEISVSNSTLRLELYDNGEIDYDSVSVFLNSKMILPKTMLTHKAIRLTIALDPDLEFNDVSMFAENLGMIPPNTAAMILYDGKTRYEIMLTSDLNKSATLRLKKKN